ncbi:MAG TPA: hypothetical protein VGN88_13910 [Phycisphaerae bacterium]
MTLTELLMALTVLAILSVGATNLIIGSLRTDRVLMDSNRQVSEMEFSLRRMTHNIRVGSGITLNGSTGFSLISQADPNNNGQTYTITYAYDSVAKTLSESSTQYGITPTANIIAYNVTAFSVTQASASPLLLSIDITIATSNAPATRRNFQVWNRNS